MLDLESAIKHAEEVAEQNEKDAIVYSNCKNHKKNLFEIGLAENAEKKCCKCAEEHRQLAEWLKELKMLKEFMGDDFGTLCICALRYCHGRRSYMPSTVQRIVRNHFGYLSDTDFRVILEDEKRQNDMDLWGDDCDKFDWQRFYGDLKAYMEEK